MTDDLTPDAGVRASTRASTHRGFLFADLRGYTSACGSLGSGVALMPVGSENWQAQPGEPLRIVAIEVDDSTVSCLQSIEASPADSVSELEQFFDLADRVVQSIGS